MKYLPLLVFCIFFNVSKSPAQPKIQLTDFSTGFTRPVDIAHCDDSRLYIVEQRGLIWVIDSLGVKVSTQPFLDIDASVNSNGNEQGLLGLAFHPKYKQNGFFYVYYTRNDGDTHVSRFSRDLLDENKADPGSEKILLYADQPYSNHNGGCVKFGPDGYLYVGLGDGGSAGDPQNNGQKKGTFLGKILRIDVDGGDPYAVPADNPFVNDPAWKPEIWHTGLRNPWRFSFDLQTGDMWIGDVGQGDWEEIDFQQVGVGGLNYGWRCYEGNHAYNTSGCQPQSSYVRAAFEYDNNALGCSVTGGFVYRGSKYPELFGTYIFTDYCSGRWWTVRRNADGNFTSKLIADLANNQYSSLGEGPDGELYVAMLSAGKIQRISELCSFFKISGTATDETCTGDRNGSIALTLTNPAGSPTIAWSNGSNSANLDSLAAGGYRVTVTDANGCVRVDSFEIKNQSPAPPQVLSINMTLCEGQAATLDCPAAPAGLGYQWYLFGQPLAQGQVQNLITTEAGSYQVAYTGSPCNSTLSAPINVSFVPPPMPVASVSGDTLFVSGGVGFGQQWYLGGSPIAGATDTFFVATTTGFYQFGVSNGFCTVFSDSIFVEVVGTDLPREVASFSLAPNPTTGDFILKMEMSAPQKIALRLFDASDKTLQTASFFEKKISQNFDLNHLPAGTYFLEISFEKGGFVRRVVKI